MFRKIASFLGFLTDCTVLALALAIVYNAYLASAVPASTPPPAAQAPVQCPQPPQVDWSGAWELWRGDTGDMPEGWLGSPQPWDDFLIEQPKPEQPKLDRSRLIEPLYRVPKPLPPVKPEPNRTPPRVSVRPDRVC
jgi:hypothetical protein